MNNNGAGLVLASMALADHPQVMLPVIFYNLAQHLIASIVDLTAVQKLASNAAACVRLKRRNSFNHSRFKACRNQGRMAASHR